MPMVQLDLFGWSKVSQRSIPVESANEITEDVLANALIKHFGNWVPSHPMLLGDDWTVCETLVTIHKVFTRNQLGAVSAAVWHRAWEAFEQYYLTKRGRSDFYRKWSSH